jgi:transketolase
MRDAFSDTLVALAQADPNVLLLTGDHGYALFDAFRRECPNQYINAGIAEQNMVGMAAGLARVGFRPFVYGLAAFIPVRVIEQIKLDVAHDNLPVIFIGDGAGFVYSHLGTSHQSTEDIACSRAIPNITIYSPADRFEVSACMNTAYKSGLSSYIRMGKSDRGDIHKTTLDNFSNSMLNVHQASDARISIVATGSMVKTALTIVSEGFIEASVWSVPTIKPVEVNQVIQVCESNDLIITLEEHSVLGGLGSVIAEISSEFCPVRVLRIGVQDRFSHNCGTYEYLLKEHGLDVSSIKAKIHKFFLSPSL